MSDIMLPSYERPPLNEVVCGVSFKPPSEFTIAHLGHFWSSFQNEFPKCEEQAPIVLIQERFDTKDELQIRRAPTSPWPRTWFVADDDRRLVQLQKDRLLYNWRQVDLTDEYPRFGAVIAEFWRALDRFQEFVQTRELGKLQFTQCELTYVNLFLEGREYSGLHELGSILPDLRWEPDKRALSHPDKIDVSFVFSAPERTQRLYLRIQSAIEKVTLRNALRVELTVRGGGDVQNRDAMANWFDEAHKWIVLGFTDITHPRVQQEVWKRVQ